MQQILNISTNFIGKYKGILIFLENGERIFISITEDAIPHLLGLKKIDYYKNKSPSWIIKRIKEGKITIKKLKMIQKFQNK